MSFTIEWSLFIQDRFIGTVVHCAPARYSRGLTPSKGAALQIAGRVPQSSLVSGSEDRERAPGCRDAGGCAIIHRGDLGKGTDHGPGDVLAGVAHGICR